MSSGRRRRSRPSFWAVWAFDVCRCFAVAAFVYGIWRVAVALAWLLASFSGQ